MRWIAFFLAGALPLFLNFSLAEAGSGAVYIGDSHSVGFLGKKLFLELGHRRAVVGTRAGHWLSEKACGKLKCIKGFAEDGSDAFNSLLHQGKPPADFPGLPEILETENPHTVVIALGTNDAMPACEGGLEKAAKDIGALAALTAGRRCVWVGPTLFVAGAVFRACGGRSEFTERYSAVVDAFRAAAENAGCRFIDSRDFRKADGSPLVPDQGDNLHFGSKLGTHWGELVIRQLGN